MKKLIFVFMFIFLISSVLAMSQPEGFNGDIIVKGGGNVEGKTLVGFLNGNEAGSAIIHNNKFDIIITDETEANEGGEIEFYIGDEKAEETFIFETMLVVSTDLTFTILLIDDDDTTTNNGDSPSGGNSGGDSPNYNPVSDNNQDKGEANELSDLSVENLNENQQTSSGVTGSAILDFAKSSGGITIGGILLIGLIGAIAFLNFKKGKSVKEENNSEKENSSEDSEIEDSE